VESKVTEDSYDYIIAGGGLAGCLLADRLSADGKKVLVLEAGRPDYTNIMIRIPAGILRLFKSKYDWQHETGGEKACNGRNVFLQRGKVSKSMTVGGRFQVRFVLHASIISLDFLLRFSAARLAPTCAFTIGDLLKITTIGTSLAGPLPKFCHFSRLPKRTRLAVLLISMARTVNGSWMRSGTRIH
jgi:hypothetical protein